MSRPIVVACEQTCEACPSQWEGRVEDGRWFYGRYRWGSLSLGMGADLDEAVRGRNHLDEAGRQDGWDGCMTTEEFVHSTSQVLDWSRMPHLSATTAGE